MAPLRFVRIRPGLGPESARVIHPTDVEGELAPWKFSELPGKVTEPSGTLPVLCGALLIPGSYDVLPGLAGMPCVPCLIKTAPDEPQQIAG